MSLDILKHIKLLSGYSIIFILIAVNSSLDADLVGSFFWLGLLVCFESLIYKHLMNGDYFPTHESPSLMVL